MRDTNLITSSEQTTKNQSENELLKPGKSRLETITNLGKDEVNL
jgi:hypothetical protein